MMSRPFLAAVALALCSVTHAASYVIDIAGQHAFITFKASHLGYSYIIGRFEKFDGSYSYDPKNLAVSAASVEIDAASLDTNHAERDKHLKSDEFLDVGKYPRIKFQSTGFDGSADTGKLSGNLTIRDVTRAVVLEVARIGEGDDPWGGYRSGFQGEVTLNAADYGLPSWVGEIEVNLIVEGIRQ